MAKWSDDEIPSRCLDAFEAMAGSDFNKRRFLNIELGVFPRSDASSAFLTRRIATLMAGHLRRHLKLT